MKIKRKKTRSIASYRAASLKGARARKLTQWRQKELEADYREFIRQRLETQSMSHTIDRIPKVEWP